MAAAKGDVSFDTGGPEAWRTQEQREKKRKAISWSTASVNAVSFLTVLISLSTFTMDVTCWSHFSFGCRAWLNLTWPPPPPGGWQNKWLEREFTHCGYDKKETPKIFICTLRSAKVKTTACLCGDMKPISVMELSKCHKKGRGAIKHPCPAPFLADGFSNQQDLLFWSLKQQGWLGWPSCWLLRC